jgi:membrane protein required for colicin V production
VTLDHALLALVALFALAGAFSGALRQLIKLAGVVAGWLAAVHLAPRLAPWLFGARPLPWQRAAAAVGAFAAAALLVSILGGLLRRAVQGPEGRPGPADRALGALLGGAKAALAAWVVLSALALAGGRVHLGPWSFDPRASAAGAFAARHNLVAAADPAAARKVEQLLRLTQDPQARRELVERDPGLRALLEDPRLRTLLEGIGAAGEGARDKARELLEDPAAGPLLERLDPPR